MSVMTFLHLASSGSLVPLYHNNGQNFAASLTIWIVVQMRVNNLLFVQVRSLRPPLFPTGCPLFSRFSFCISRHLFPFPLFVYEDACFLFGQLHTLTVPILEEGFVRFNRRVLKQPVQWDDSQKAFTNLVVRSLSLRISSLSLFLSHFQSFLYLFSFPSNPAFILSSLELCS